MKSQVLHRYGKELIKKAFPRPLTKLYYNRKHISHVAFKSPLKEHLFLRALKVLKIFLLRKLLAVHIIDKECRPYFLIYLMLSILFSRGI